MAMFLRSPAFGQMEEIPAKYTCEGADVSPPLAFAGAPDGTKSFALIVDDPDSPDPRAPKRAFAHWVLYDIPATATSLSEDARDAGSLPRGTRVGTNDWHKMAWGGPCPRIGRHRYFFKLYALNVVFTNLVGPTKSELEEAMEGHVLETAELVGTYIRLSERARETAAPPELPAE